MKTNDKVGNGYKKRNAAMIAFNGGEKWNKVNLYTYRGLLQLYPIRKLYSLGKLHAAI